MRILRRTIRLIGFSVVTAVFFSIRVAGKLVSFRNPARDRSNRLWVLRTWSRISLRLFGFSVAHVGTAPPTPALIVSNHLSYIDVMAISSLVDVVYVTKKDVSAWPIIGPIASSFAPIYVDRESVKDVVRVNDRISESLAGGENVVLFAEGTSSGGDDVLPMKASLLQAAARAQRPVYYASVTYRTAAHEPHPRDAVCWWRDMELIPHLVELLEIRAPSVLVTFGEQPIVAEQRKVLARKLHTAIQSIFTPVSQKGDV
ncbi:MAG: lysophospholipid acyltransferase family protein [Verrucomicrobia bacterium]|nr:lysophospholipid acyltransferase family protein [Verrucomicrobiota bacterium]MDA1088011.1 lysophospholipid acyltransferase family protein [Verrucomicrobiota bacterium]